MKVKYTRITQEEIEKDVEFPIYRKFAESSPQRAKWYHKINDKLEELSINFYEDQNAYIEIDKDVEFSGEEDYEFGLGKYACTKEEFGEAYEKALNIIMYV